MGVPGVRSKMTLMRSVGEQQAGPGLVGRSPGSHSNGGWGSKDAVEGVEGVVSWSGNYRLPHTQATQPSPHASPPPESHGGRPAPPAMLRSQCSLPPAADFPSCRRLAEIFLCPLPGVLSPQTFTKLTPSHPSVASSAKPPWTPHLSWLLVTS